FQRGKSVSEALPLFGKETKREIFGQMRLKLPGKHIHLFSATRKLTVMILASLLILAALCEPADARKVSVAVPDLSTSIVAFVVAKEKHFYDEEGLEVELIKMSAPLANLALIGGNVEFGAAGAAAIPSVMRGAPLKFLFH